MAFEEFLAKQEEIYAKFRAQEAIVQQQGLTPDAAVMNEVGGYLIAWKHPQSVAKAAADLSRKIGEIVPAMVYSKWNVHTTLSDHGIGPKFRVDPRNLEHGDLLQRLCAGVKEALGNIPVESQQCTIEYPAPWLYNRTTIIAKGIPNLAFMSLGDAVRNACQEQGIVLRPPWGTHITVSRFRTPVGPSEAKPLVELLQSTPSVGTSIPEAIEVGFFSMEGGDFEYQAYERLPLK